MLLQVVSVVGRGGTVAGKTQVPPADVHWTVPVPHSGQIVQGVPCVTVASCQRQVIAHSPVAESSGVVEQQPTVPGAMPAVRHASQWSVLELHREVPQQSALVVHTAPFAWQHSRAVPAGVTTTLQVDVPSQQRMPGMVSHSPPVGMQVVHTPVLDPGSSHTIVV
jgi:hypothetical protein